MIMWSELGSKTTEMASLCKCTLVRRLLEASDETETHCPNFVGSHLMVQDTGGMITLS